MVCILIIYIFFSVKPSPFLIFDEMDAALDNANINRVAKFFMKMRGSTQIIIISHHDLTCVCADAIIGVNIYVSTCLCDKQFKVGVNLMNQNLDFFNSQLQIQVMFAILM